ncbi:MAG TPA: NusG domain II-containing protein [Candidatus Scybalocola faecavium]|nr:NusG domain II-containing protein [Candidatus Scybalocola faecavium]
MSKQIKICILIVIILAAAGIGAIFLLQNIHPDGRIARIYHHGECIETIDLDQVREAYEFTVAGENGAYNTIRVEPGRIAIIQASCPDKVCVHMGYISDSAAPITCLPNEVVIRITGKDTDGPDAVAQGGIPLRLDTVFGIFPVQVN